MDRLIYTAMTGASAALNRQDAVTHNLANATSYGYKAAEESFRSAPVQGDGLATRTFVADATTGSDFRSGAIRSTGRSLDVAVQGSGWLALQMPDGSEAYTRNGSLTTDATGQLQTRSGIPIAGESGPVVIPPDSEVLIGRDGTISAVPSDGNRANATAVGKIKLVNPETNTLTRGNDGLFRLSSGGTAEADPAVALTSGALEESNVSVVEQMVQMIGLSRHFELQTKLIQTAEANDKAAQQILGR